MRRHSPGCRNGRISDQAQRGGVLRAGFTLIEMLVVIVIISVLAGLISSGLVVARRQAAKRRAGVLLLRIALAVNAYELDFGDFPPGDGGAGSGMQLYIALNTNRRNGPYLRDLQESELKDLDFDGIKDIIDTWNQPIRYIHHIHYDGDPGRDSYRVISDGPDGKPDTRDDINNWNAK